MENILWWPSFESDEMMPKGKTSPNDYILGREGEDVVFGRIESNVEDGYTNIHKIGDVVEFIKCENFGTFEIIFKKDGTYQSHDGKPLPSDYNSLWFPDDIDSWGCDIGELQNCLKDLDDDSLFDVPQTVGIALWSDVIEFRLVPADNGTGCKFVAVGEEFKQ